MPKSLAPSYKRPTENPLQNVPTQSMSAWTQPRRGEYSYNQHLHIHTHLFCVLPQLYIDSSNFLNRIHRNSSGLIFYHNYHIGLVSLCVGIDIPRCVYNSLFHSSSMVRDVFPYS